MAKFHELKGGHVPNRKETEYKWGGTIMKK